MNIRTLTAFLLISLTACGEPDSDDTSSAIQEATAEATIIGQVQQPLNPNGDSELALFMRAMYDDGMKMKTAIRNGEKATSALDISTLYTPNATEPDKVATPEYHAMAKAYEAAFNAVQKSEGERQEAAYKSMVAACTSCHQAMCPGPIVKIRKMEL